CSTALGSRRTYSSAPTPKPTCRAQAVRTAESLLWVASMRVLSSSNPDRTGWRRIVAAHGGLRFRGPPRERRGEREQQRCAGSAAAAAAAGIPGADLDRAHQRRRAVAGRIGDVVRNRVRADDVGVDL